MLFSRPYGNCSATEESCPAVFADPVHHSFRSVFFKRLRIPSLISLIIAGAVVGPNGLNLMLRDSSIVLFGTVGLLYIMFLAGLEIDVADFKKNSGKSILFGLYTFLISQLLGIFRRSLRA